jgi:hypothetical protein
MSLLALLESVGRIDPKRTQNTETGSGGGSSSNTRKFFNDLQEPYVEPTPTPSSNPPNLGFVRLVNSVTDWNNLPAVLLPGDVVKLNAEIPTTLTYRGNNPGAFSAGPFPSGTEAAPITITAAPGVYINPNNITGVDGGLDLIRARHVDVVGIKVKNCRFPIRCITSGGSVNRPMRIHHNETHSANEAMVYVGALQDAGLNESSYVSVKFNKIHDSSGNVAFSEGVYIGTGATAWAWKDDTHDVEVAYNEIYNVRGDGVDIKPGCYNIFVHHNAIHDIAADMGGAISAAIPDTAWPLDPNPATIKPIWIFNNWIWNVGYAFNGVSGSAYGIRANFAGMLVFNNVLWGFAVKGGGNTRGIDASVYQTVTTFASTFFNNTVWVDDAIVNAHFGGATDDFFFFENITADGTLSQGTGNFTNDFIGPSVTLNPTSDSSTNSRADAGFGPGSAFLLKAGSSHINSVVTTDPVHRTTDASGISVPRGPTSDRGAYEFV